VVIWFALLFVAATSTCMTGKQPPKGPATALLRQRTVQMLPVEAGGGDVSFLFGLRRGDMHAYPRCRQACRASGR
jgi:hypothetical protein